jgi:DNA-binding winged helix-turn-helix (wHTH) protein/tetratricopeptide (TPR) repeat protein
MATIYAFGPFRLDAGCEILFRGTEPLPVGKRAVILLRLLVERRGVPVSKDALIEGAWSGLAVEESNLPVQIGALRKVLGQEPGGERWIETLPRRGYRFVGPTITNVENSAAVARLPAATQDTEGPQPEPDRTTPPQTEPQRRRLTIMSCELDCAGLDLEDMREAVKIYQSCVTEIVSAFRGFVAKHVGNTVLVYFGYPVAHEDDVEQAVHAGLALCTAVQTKTAVKDPLRCRIGIATSSVIIDDLLDEKQEHSVVGDALNTAVRLQMSAPQSAVVIDDASRRLTGKLFECSEIGKTEAGATDVVAAWRVLRARAVESRFEALHAGALTPFVGRRRELDTLARWRREATDRLFVIDITGDPGIGKSRLLREFRDTLVEEDVFVLSGNCWPSHQQTSLGPFIEIVRRVFRLDADDTEPEIAAKLEKGLAFVGLTTSENLGLLMNLLGLAPPPGSLAGLDGVLIGLRTRSLLLDLLRERRRIAPIAVLLEDVHWIDHASKELLDRLIAAPDAPPLLIVNTYRSGYQPPWLGHGSTALQRLEPLSSTDTMQIAEMRLGSSEADADLVRLIAEKADGNPLFAEEIANFLIERDMIRRPETPDEAGTVVAALPPSLESLLMTRLDRLHPVDKAMLQAASVIGRRFSPRLLFAAVEHPVEERLAAMKALDLVRLDDRSQDYVFKHALVRDVLYAGMLSGQRAALHLKIASEIEREGAGSFIEVAETLAHHYSRTDQTDKAVEFLTLSASKSLGIYSLDEAEQFARMALAGARSQNPKCMDLQVATIMVELARALSMKSRSIDIIALLEPEIELVGSLGDVPQVPILLDLYAFALFAGCRFREAKRAQDHALAVAERLNDDRAKAYSKSGIMLLSIVIDPMPLPEFERFAEVAFAEAERAGDVYIVGRMMMIIGWNFVHRGLTIEGRKWMNRLTAFGRQHQDPRPVAQALFILGSLDMMAEDYASALGHGEECMRTACTPLDRLLGQTVVGISQLLLGRVAEGAKTIDLHRAEAAANNWRYTVLGTDAPFGVAMLLRGEFKRGVKWLEEVIDRCENQLEYRVGADYARLFLAEFYIALISRSRKAPMIAVLKNLLFLVKSRWIAPERAEELLTRAIQNPLFSKHGTFHARIAFNLGLLNLKMNRFDVARRWFDEARVAASAQNASNWLRKIEAATGAASPGVGMRNRQDSAVRPPI